MPDSIGLFCCAGFWEFNLASNAFNSFKGKLPNASLSISKTVTYLVDCKIKESKMIEELKRLQEVKKELRRRIIKGI